jgi:hypothetical protein
MTSDSRNELGGMTRIIVGAFYVCFGLEMVGQPFVEGMCVSSCAMHRRKLVTRHGAVISRYEIVGLRTVEIVQVQNRPA